MIVLAGDIGGTKTRLGLFTRVEPDAPLITIHQERFVSRENADFESLCTGFLKERPEKPGAAAFGIAGPIVNGRCEATNLHWVIEQSSLERLLSCRVTMINDLESMAYGIAELRPDEFLTLNPGVESPRAARAIIAAGTGMGEGYMVWNAGCDRHIPSASEGGHTDFAARNPAEIDLLRRLLERFERVSVERVVSGAGIRSIFDHLAGTGRYEIPAVLRASIDSGDPAAAISHAAINGGTPICIETMRRFVAAYGADAGNLALKVMARGGVYVGGGIAPKILPLMTDGVFMSNFLDKGRFAPLMSTMPVRLMLNEEASLLGAASIALRQPADN